MSRCVQSKKCQSSVVTEGHTTSLTNSELFASVAHDNDLIPHALWNPVMNDQTDH
jgi:hypothetical protein